MPDMSEWEEQDGRATGFMSGGRMTAVGTQDERMTMGVAPAKGRSSGGSLPQKPNRRRSSVSKLVMQSYDETAKDIQVAAAPSPAGVHTIYICSLLRTLPSMALWFWRHSGFTLTLSLCAAAAVGR